MNLLSSMTEGPFLLPRLAGTLLIIVGLMVGIYGAVVGDSLFYNLVNWEASAEENLAKAREKAIAATEKVEEDLSRALDRADSEGDVERAYDRAEDAFERAEADYNRAEDAYAETISKGRKGDRTGNLFELAGSLVALPLADYPFLPRLAVGQGGLWMFLMAAIFPIGLGILLIVKTEGMRLSELPDSAVMYGRVAGVVIAAAGLALGIWGATQGGKFWGFLTFGSVPIVIGLLILLTVEGMRGSDTLDKVSFYGRLVGLAVIIAGFGLASWASAFGGFWAFLGVAVPIMGVGLLVILSVELIEARRGAKLLDNAVLYGKLAGGVIAIAGLAFAIWVSMSVVANGFLFFLLAAPIPMGIGFLIHRWAEDLDSDAQDPLPIPFGWLALGILAVMGVASGIWLAVEVGSNHGLLIFLGTLIVPVGLGLLCSPILRKPLDTPLSPTEVTEDEEAAEATQDAQATEDDEGE